MSWTSRVKNEEELRRVKEDGCMVHKRKEGRLTGLYRSYLGANF